MYQEAEVESLWRLLKHPFCLCCPGLQRGGPGAHESSWSALSEGCRARGPPGHSEDPSAGPGGPLSHQGRPTAQPHSAAAAGKPGSAGRGERPIILRAVWNMPVKVIVSCFRRKSVRLWSRSSSSRGRTWHSFRRNCISPWKRKSDGCPGKDGPSRTSATKSAGRVPPQTSSKPKRSTPPLPKEVYRWWCLSVSLGVQHITFFLPFCLVFFVFFWLFLMSPDCRVLDVIDFYETKMSQLLDEVR